eukprot:gnl/Hemi2/26873_TR9042_c1_g2_i2.p1 gnl/Hemi2/26873_TR9042_c1_g2~~gnl/Hemi2/26873_TR9042_c1_g2_i2.p1  ORF type:complete len:199 (-),score=65.34 gnl/Hemi2/26873_TR9042_c1_g2_i2:169-765(-)
MSQAGPAWLCAVCGSGGWQWVRGYAVLGGLVQLSSGLCFAVLGNLVAGLWAVVAALFAMLLWWDMTFWSPYDADRHDWSKVGDSGLSYSAVCLLGLSGVCLSVGDAGHSAYLGARNSEDFVLASRWMVVLWAALAAKWAAMFLYHTLRYHTTTLEGFSVIDDEYGTRANKSVAAAAATTTVAATKPAAAARRVVSLRC